MRPPYPAPYWDSLTPRQRLNDLVHKIAQRTGQTYPAAYATAAGIIDAPEHAPKPYAVRLARAGKLDAAIEALCRYHREATCLT